jgi:CzcA family heavy metal efflux pump
MLNAIIHWSLGNRALVLVLALLLLAAGAYVTPRMPIDVFPDLTAPTVTVVTEAHGMAPVEVETRVSFPIEASLNGTAGVRRVRSSTSVGISVIWAEFEWGEDVRAARQAVTEKLNVVAATLPPEVERPVLAPMSSVMGEVLLIALVSDRHDSIELRTAAETLVRRRLLSVPGVSQVTPIGGDRKQYQVALSPARLGEYGISVARVADALSAANENVSAGFLVEGGSEHLVTGLGRARGLDDIRDTVVDLRGGVPVRISDLGDARVGEAPRRGAGSARGRPAVILGIQKQPGVGTLALTSEIERVLDDLQAKLPEGMRIDKRIFRQADFIEVAIRNVLHALRDGSLLVVLVVLVFLANVRATLITLAAIPLSLVAAVLVLSAAGASIDTMTLGGMAIAMGALVDDAIIDVENVFRRLRGNAALPPEERRPAIAVVYDASVEIRGSIVFATIIILLVFLPLFFLPGVEGRLLRPLGLAYIVALFTSLVVAMTVTPVLCSFVLPRSRAVLRGREPAVVHALKAAYARVLRLILPHPWVVSAGGAALLVAAVAAWPFLGREFLPQFNEGALTIHAVTLPGTSLPESDALGTLVEEIILRHPEITSVGRRTGRAELDEHALGVESSELDASFVLKDRTREEFLEALRQDLALVPGMMIAIGQPISHRIDHLLSGTRASVAVKIFGSDLEKLRKLGEKAWRAMAGVRGNEDLSVEQQMDIPLLTVRFDRAALSRHGIVVRDAARALEAAVQGLAVSRVLEGLNTYDLVVRIAEPDGWRMGTLGDLPLDTPGGAKVPLKAVAEIRTDIGPNTISRENVERKIVVQSNVAGRDIGSFVEETRRLVDPIVAAEPGYSVEYGGQFKAAVEAERLLAALGFAVVLGIALLLYLAFGSAREAALVLVNLPLALIGGVAGVFVSGSVLSVASLIGFITVFGIAARNGIMLVSHIRHLQEREGVTDFREAVLRGALERLAPILMTALAAGMALIPLALGGGKPGSEIQTPMAIVILFGLLTSMLLNMIVVPVLYLRFGSPAVSTTGGAA